jgi:hypothetical protein
MIVCVYPLFGMPPFVAGLLVGSVLCGVYFVGRYFGSRK